MTCVYQEIRIDRVNRAKHKARFVCDNCYKDHRTARISEVNGPKSWSRIESLGDKLFGYLPVTLHFCSAKCEQAYRKKKGK